MCNIEKRKMYKRRWYEKCRSRIMRGLNENDVIRFWNKVNKTGVCWLWTASVNHRGYGILGVDGRNLRAPRISYELYYGPIPPDVQVLHKCDTPACVNPEHLFPGNNTINVMDRHIKGRTVSGKDNGITKLTPEIVRQIRIEYQNVGVYCEIGRMHNISPGTVHAIITGRTWKHVI